MIFSWKTNAWTGMAGLAAVYLLPVLVNWWSAALLRGNMAAVEWPNVYTEAASQYRREKLKE